MKILIPILSFSSAGGMRVLSKLADAMIDQGHQVEFLASHLINEPYYPTKAKIIKFRNVCTKIPVIRGLSNLFGMFNYLRVNKSNYDVVLSNYNLTAFPVFLSTLGTGKGYYYIQAYEPEFYNKKTIIGLISYTLASLSYKLPLKKVVNSPIYKNFKCLNAEYVVEPGIDLDIFHYDPKERNEGVINIGCIGRKLKWKGTLEIIQAVNNVRQMTGINLALTVAFELPDGVTEDDYSFVHLVKPHGDENLGAFYRSVELFIATGLIQDGAFHYPCLESMASGCVVISNYGPADENNALLIRLTTVDKIQTEILRYLNFTAEDISRIRKLGREVSAQFSWSNTARKMEYFLNKPNS
ncbi:glycosyltransferase family 4 protein [Pseudomonas saxonica]|uniref:Glycosyltransferase family 4 protein n=1 Tax=Pseudomonas saxonica TaxID=2600598 RepID=A0ABY3GKT8_9PSED|nr:glycosyltransferase family 4 protein [Pseudomonas saxonica]TWR92321.1 glycosyltransferase family 4 protein [Pseudomonas saxonica]